MIIIKIKMQACCAIQKNGNQCTIKVEGQMRCKRHALKNYGPNETKYDELGYIHRKDVKPLANVEIYRDSYNVLTNIDVIRCSSRLMLNDNIINYFLSKLKGLGDASNVIIENTYFFYSLQSIVQAKSTTIEKKQARLQKLFKSAHNYTSVLIPIHRELHWSLTIIHNISNFLSLVNSSDKTISEADIKASDTSIIMLDSSKYHRTQDIMKTIRSALEVRYGTVRHVTACHGTIVQCIDWITLFEQLAYYNLKLVFLGIN